MKIAVCVSHVPDTATKIKIGADEKSIDQNGVTYIINPYDEFAVEEALKCKEKYSGEIVIVSLGGEPNKETIQKALAMGADKGVLLKSDHEMDSISIAKTLAKEINEINPDIIFCGKQSVDFDDASIPQLLSEFLGFNCVTVAVDLKIEDKKVTVEREIEGGKEVVTTELPVVIGAQKGLNEPRYASLKGIMAAKKKTIEEKPAAEMKNSSEILKMYKPAPKKPGRILGTDKSAVPELVRLLREEAKVI
jgi:electron transfer flavoprotein beta subunit